ncbi:hypothetical protein KNP414_03492 [Paenibacillus mucilaginosus KNP414]|uniref:Uncharacterized protein n=1 Tax=Paenibacillus mucilaginosus (strain KNP414) TaxID=1036673 RepID=F8FB83_PAEMK|nr:hypothetical protein KNP414_03492 [Paenibacillus mucilaginosus KNP414]
MQKETGASVRTVNSLGMKEKSVPILFHINIAVNSDFNVGIWLGLPIPM